MHVKFIWYMQQLASSFLRDLNSTWSLIPHPDSATLFQQFVALHWLSNNITNYVVAAHFITK